MSSNGEKETRWFREIDSSTVGAYVVLVYETWVGDRNDPATQIEEWTSFFHAADFPAERSEAVDQQQNIPPYVDAGKDSHYSRLYLSRFEGLQGAIVNEKIRVVQERDHNIEKFKQEQAAMLNTEDSYNRYRHTYKGLNYEDFLGAIDRVAENEDDEEAWTILDKWRSRALRQEERV